MRILVSNDDGIHAPGLRHLYKELKKLGQVTVVAPLEEKSTTGHSLTLHKPLRLLPVEKDFYACTGSPADSVYLGIREIIQRKPDIVVAGPNRGPNLGQDVYYSGTVSAAREASILGIPAVAVSLCTDFSRPAPDSKLHYGSAATLVRRLIESFILNQGPKRKDVPAFQMPEHTLLNLNVPDLPLSKIKGIKLGRQGFRYYSGSILRRKDHRGRDYFWVGGSYKGYRKEEGTDCHTVEKGFASLTPVRLDSTDYETLADLSRFSKAGDGVIL